MEHERWWEKYLNFICLSFLVEGWFSPVLVFRFFIFILYVCFITTFGNMIKPGITSTIYFWSVKPKKPPALSCWLRWLYSQRHNGWSLWMLSTLSRCGLWQVAIKLDAQDSSITDSCHVFFLVNWAVHLFFLNKMMDIIGYGGLLQSEKLTHFKLTPPKFNIAPKRWWLEDVCLSYWVKRWLFRGKLAVKLPGCT